MQQSINLNLMVSLSETGFSLDELIFRLQATFQEKGFSGIVELILNWVDEALCIDLTRREPRLGEHSFKPCCDGFVWELKDREDRSLRTSICDLQFNWRRLRCTNCGKCNSYFLRLTPKVNLTGMNAPYQNLHHVAKPVEVFQGEVFVGGGLIAVTVVERPP